MAENPEDSDRDEPRSKTEVTEDKTEEEEDDAQGTPFIIYIS